MDSGFDKSAYNATDYERPSVTADIVIFTMDEENELNILLIQRAQNENNPYAGAWALPGGFLNTGKESVDETALRELQEETGITNAYLKQLYTFSNPNRDPRTHVITVAYTALIPKSQLSFQAGDDAGDAKLFKVNCQYNRLILMANDLLLTEDQLAFDHADIIKMAITRLRNRIEYEPDAFYLLEDPDAFTIYELKCVFESIKGKPLDTANFRKMFQRNYVAHGFATPLERKKKAGKAKAATAFKCWLYNRKE